MISKWHRMEDHEGTRWPMRGDHFDVTIGLPVWVSNVDHRDLSGCAVDLFVGLRMEDCVERVIPRDTVLIGAARELNSHTSSVPQTTATEQWPPGVLVIQSTFDIRPLAGGSE